MANTKIQVKRTSIAGRTANVTNSGNAQYIDAGELALNMADGILYSSNGSALIEIGANNTILKSTSTITATGIVSGSELTSTNASGDEGGQVNLAKPPNATTDGGVTIDAYQNKVRIFEQGGSARGVYIDLTAAAAGVGTNLLASTGSGTVTSVGSANGIAGGPITGSGTLYAVAGNSTLFVNASGIHVNTSSQYVWTNTHTFQANIAFTGNNISVVSNTGSVMFNGSGDTNWRIGRSTGSTTKFYYSNNTLDIIAAASNLEGFVIGQPGGNTYFETGYAGTFSLNPLYVGNSTANVSITSTTVNAASHTVGTSFTANSTLVNAVALNVVNTINVGSFGTTNGVNITNTTLVIGNSTANAIHNYNIVQVANSTGTSNINPTYITTPTVNATSNLNVGTFGTTNGVNIQNTAAVIGNSTANATFSYNLIRVANSTGTSNINPTFIVTPTVNATSNVNIGTYGTTNGVNIQNTFAVVGNTTAYTNVAFGNVTVTNATGSSIIGPTFVQTPTVNATANLNVGTFGTTNGVNIQNTAIVVGNTTANATYAYNLIQAANSTGTANLSPTTLTIGTTTVNGSLINTSAINVVNQINTATFYATTSANVGTAFTANSSLVNAVALNVVNQINTATFYATTSANIGTALTANSTVVNVVAANVVGGLYVGGTLTVVANVNLDSGTFFVNGTNNRVGINNTAPDASLTVTGTANVSGNVVVGGFFTQNGMNTRVVDYATGATLTINCDSTDLANSYNTEAVGTLTIAPVTGTARDGQKLMLRLRSTNIQTFAWNVSVAGAFAGSTDLTLPTASSGSSKYDYMGFIYSTATSRWHLLAKNFGF